MLQADAGTRDILQRYRTAKEILEASEKRVEELKQLLQESIGSAEGIEAEGIGRVLWRVSKGRTSTDWEAIARRLGATEDLIKEFTRQGNGFRTFRASFK